MAADNEKKIRVSITGDATGLNREIDRSSKEMRKAFSNANLDDVLEDAEKHFTNVADRIKAVTETLRQERKLTVEDYNKRIAEHPNDEMMRKKLDRESEVSLRRQDKAFDRWSELAILLKAAIDRGILNEKGEKIEPEEAVPAEGTVPVALEPESDYATPGPHRSSRQRASLMSRMIARGSEGDILGAAQEGISSPNGILSLMGANASMMLIIGSLGAAVVQAIRQGYEGVKMENKIAARKDFNFDQFDENSAEASKLGMSVNEFKDFTLSQMQTLLTYNMNQQQTVTEVMRRLELKKGYNLSDSEVSAFDQFKQQDIKAANSTEVIATILARSEKAGILGVNKDDFSLLPQKIQTVSDLLSQQKSMNETVDSNTAIGMMIAGNKIGGRFADDRAASSLEAIANSIRNPDSAGMKAYVFEMLRKAHPNESYTRLLARQEGGATAENLHDVLSGIAQMPAGEYRTMILRQILGNWQNAVRFDDKNGLQTLLNETNKQHIISKDELQKQFDTGKSRGEKFTTVFESWMSKLETTMTTQVGKPIVDAINNKLTPADAVNWFSLTNLWANVPASAPQKVNTLKKAAAKKP